MRAEGTKVFCSKEHNVSRMFPLTPALSLKGEGAVRAGIIL